MKCIFILTSLIFNCSVWATTIFLKHEPISNVFIKVIKAYPASEYIPLFASETFDLTSQQGITHTAVCNEKKLGHNEIGESFIIYKNIANIKIKHFHFSSNKVCKYIANYIRGVFEFIDEEHPIYIKLNVKAGNVAEFHLPNLDPFMDQLPSKKITKKLRKAKILKNIQL